MDSINATIITIGDELLIGQVIDTNSAFIAQSLNAIGVAVKSRIAVGDDAKAIKEALDEAALKNQIIIFSLAVSDQSGSEFFCRIQLNNSDPDPTIG